MAADKKAADEEALIEADIPPSSSMDHFPTGISDNSTSSNSGGSAAVSNPPVNRVAVVPDLYDHIHNNSSDDDSDSYEEDEEDKRLITIANRANKKNERIV